MTRALAALSPDSFWGAWVLLASAALGALYVGFRRIRRARLIEDTPTARLRSAPQGYVELEGRARAMAGEPVRAPLSGTVCCWYRFAVERRVHDRGREGDLNTRWTRVRQGVSEALFLLDDGTGDCVVDPDGAEVKPARRDRWYGATGNPMMDREQRHLFAFGQRQYRFTEEVILDGHPLYALGLLRTLGGPEDLGDVREETAALLREWKRDPSLMRRLDSNADGRVDLDEWEEARRLARLQVLQGRAERAARPGTTVLGRPADSRRPFILSVEPQRALARSHWIWGWASVAVFVILCGVLAWMLSNRL